MSTSTTYVNFENPPVVEVVCGIVFEPIDQFSTAFYGLLWNLYGNDFPKTSDHPTLPSPILQDPQKRPLRLEMALPRVWFLSEDESRLLQVQHDRFLFNWRKRETAEEYPRFETVYETFKKQLGVFEEFMKESGAGELRPTQYELTYINHIPVDDIWKDLGNLGKVLPDLTWRNDVQRFLPDPIFMRWESLFSLPKGAGTLIVRSGTARNLDTGAPVLTLDLSCRGQAGTLDFDDWFDLSHEWIVRGFADLTGEEMQTKVWCCEGEQK